MSIVIGKYKLNNGLMLAPMAGVTDTTFRLLCKKFGAEYTVSEMVCAKALCYEQLSKKKRAEVSATGRLARITEDELPMAIQLFGSEPEYMAEAARMICDGSYAGCISKAAPTAIDINMGCPVKKITSNGEGSALMRSPRLAAEIVRAVVSAVEVPVTVKIRAGWDGESINAPELAKELEQAGASLICVHARTREQMYSQGILLDVIEKTKKAVSVPVIGNGDVCCAADALSMLGKTGCDGVMIGRGAVGRPWIFSELRAALNGEEYHAPSMERRLEIAEEQLDGMVADKGERVGLAEAKKQLGHYVCGIKAAARLRAEIMTADNVEQVKKIFKTLRDSAEELI